MKAKKAFLLAAGFGTRFKPQSLFFPKPALPLFNLPQALYPASLLFEGGVRDFYYNSHHLPEVLDQSLFPHFKRKSLYEEEILLSAGGIAHAQSELQPQESFWVVNADSYISSHSRHLVQEIYDFHIEKKSLVTLVGIKKPEGITSGLKVGEKSVFLDLSPEESSLHFVGLYLMSPQIFEHIKPHPSHIFKDVLLKNSLNHQCHIFDATGRLDWYETGNEKDHINCHLQESKKLLNEPENSLVYKAHKIWSSKNLDRKMNWFQKHHVWGQNFEPEKDLDFLCLPETATGNFHLLKNSCLANGLHFNGTTPFENKVLVDSSQWLKS